MTRKSLLKFTKCVAMEITIFPGQSESIQHKVNASTRGVLLAAELVQRCNACLSDVGHRNVAGGGKG